MRPITWVLDSEDLIVHVEGGWDAFAQENDADELVGVLPIRRSLWSFIQGSELRSFYRQLFQQVRATGRTLELPYRCDAPDLRRDMELMIQPQPQGGLRLMSRVLAETTRTRVEALDRKVEHSDLHLSICSHCRRLTEDGGDSWVEPDEAARKWGVLMGEEMPYLVETICSSCALVQEGVRYLVTDYGESPDDEPLPLLIFLHGGGHERYLLRLQAPPRVAHRFDVPAFRLLSPLNVEPGHGWNVDTLDDVLDEVLTRYAVDRQRIYLTGISAGAMAAWMWARRRSFAALVVMAGQIYPAKELQGTPIWLWHGTEDRVVPLAHVEGAVDQVMTMDPRNKVSLVPGAGHDVWSRAFLDPKLWNWIFSEKDPPAWV